MLNDSEPNKNSYRRDSLPTYDELDLPKVNPDRDQFLPTYYDTVCATSHTINHLRT